MKDIEGWEGLYAIRSDGNVWSYPHTRKKKVKGHTVYSKYKGKWLRPQTITNGYKSVYLSRRGKIQHYLVHKLVAVAFLQKVQGKNQVNHINSIKTDNRVENLEWCTPHENMQHAAKSGLWVHRCGERHPNSKFTKKDILDIRKLHNDGVAIRELGRNYAVYPATIRCIVYKRTWKHI